jgi:heat shock protein HslJ
VPADGLHERCWNGAPEPTDDDDRPRRMTTRLRLTLATLLVLGGLLGACQASGLSLAGRTFLSTAVTEGGAAKALVAGTRIRLTFADGSLSASAGCNTMGADYRLDGGRLVVGNLSMTEMGCDADRMAQDQWLIAVLGARPTLALLGDQLTIDGGGVVLQLLDRRVAEPDLVLVGPTWIVDSIISGDAVSSVPDGVTARLVFHADGSLDVDDGCNQGSARWNVAGAAIEVTDLGLTKKACSGPAGDLEAAVLGTLRAPAIVASIQANRLTLMAGSGGLGLRAS